MGKKMNYKKKSRIFLILLQHLIEPTTSTQSQNIYFAYFQLPLPKEIGMDGLDVGLLKCLQISERSVIIYEINR